MRLAIIENNTVVNIALADGPLSEAWVAIDALDPQPGIGWTYTDGIFAEPVEAPAPGEPAAVHMTKRAFQNRFPKLPDGISTKWDAMDLFLKDDGYAESLGVTGAPLYALRLLINTGVNRLNASAYVDMTPGAEATQFTALLLQPGIPAVFRLSAPERDTLLDTPIDPGEAFVR